jgi:DNA-binding response OmpR family regulator
MESSGPRPAADRPLVLVIEDDPDAGALMMHCLGEAGYRTLWARDGHAALSLAQQHTLALVLLDWHLPGDLWGTPLIRGLREACRRAPVSVIVISGDPAALSAASESGVQDYLPKPFQIEDLIHVVDEHTR